MKLPIAQTEHQLEKCGQASPCVRLSAAVWTFNAGLITLIAASVVHLGAFAQVPIMLNQTQRAVVANSPINCRVPVNKLGGIELYDSVAVIKDGLIEIRPASGSQVTPFAPSLKGIIVKADSPKGAPTGQRTVTGLALFLSGTMFDELKSRDGEDLIFRSEGSLSGSIVGQSGDALIFRQKDNQVVNVPLQLITYVRSPRAFLFTLSGTPSVQKGTIMALRTAVDGIDFQPTTKSLALGIANVVGKPKSIIDDDNDDSTPSWANSPAADVARKRQDYLAPAINTGRPFSSRWP